MVSPFVKQSWTVSGVLLNMVGQGMVLSYTSCLLPALKAPDSPVHTDLLTLSWIGSSVGLSGIPGFIFSSYLMEVFGRRNAHIMAILPAIVGWILLYFAGDVAALMIGRILTGMTAGATVGLGAVVIGEYTSPENRGMFLNLKTAAVCFGSMFVHILSSFFYWRAIALIALIPLILALIIVFTWPESPAWLASKQRFDESEKSFFWLRGKTGESVKEIDELIRAQMNKSKGKELSFTDKTVDFLKKFTRKDFLKPIVIVFLGSMLLEVSGRHIFPAYALDIIGEITGSKTQSFYYTLAIDIIITASATFSSALVRIMKRRTLLFSTGWASNAVLVCVCTYLLLVSKEIIPRTYPWIPISMFVVYFILVNLGCTPIPLAFFGELFPLAHRGAGSLVGGVSLSCALNLGLQVTPFLLENIKVQGTFAVLGLTSGIILFILHFILPETKDRTLQEIEDFFNNGKFKDEVKPEDEEVAVKMLGIKQ